MFRKLATASLVALLALLTLTVVWAGLNWPPPLWVVEYGLPGAQGPTGRVARIEGIEFVEVPAGCHRVPISSTLSLDGLADPFLHALDLAPVPVSGGRPVRIPTFSGGLSVRASPTQVIRIPPGGVFLTPRPAFGWVEIGSTVWVAIDAPSVLSTAFADASDAAGLAIRTATDAEGRVADFFWERELPPGGAEWVSFRRIVLGWDSDHGGAPAFSLTPDHEHLVEPYLVESYLVEGK